MAVSSAPRVLQRVVSESDAGECLLVVAIVERQLIAVRWWWSAGLVLLAPRSVTHRSGSPVRRGRSAVGRGWSRRAADTVGAFVDVFDSRSRWVVLEMSH